MKTFVICFVALFAVVAARSVIDNVDGEDRNLHDEIDNRIVGGKPTTIEQHPHMIGLGQIYFKEIICGGAIISPIRALTAASCKYASDGSTYFILAGSSSNLGHDDPQRQKRNVTRYLSHERYDANKYHINDIAILFWKESLTFGANVRAIRLPAANAPLPYGRDASFTGYGAIEPELSSDILQAITLPVASKEACIRTWGESIQPGQFCAGVDGEGNTGASLRDIGGPLIYNNNLIGIVSREHFVLEFDVLTNVAFYNAWIKKNSK